MLESNTHINEIRRDVKMDIVRNIIIFMLVIILLRFLLIPKCPEFIIDFWNYMINIFINLLTYLKYEEIC